MSSLRKAFLYLAMTLLPLLAMFTAVNVGTKSQYEFKGQPLWDREDVLSDVLSDV